MTLPVLIERNGGDKWKGYVPVLQYLEWLKLIKRPWWWIFLMFVPGVNLVMLMIMNVELAKAFGRRSTQDQWLAAVLPWFKIPHLAFKDKTASYTGPEIWNEKHKKSFLREWGEAIVFAVVAASVIRTFFIEAYTIPTPSMEKSMLVGDYLFVSKMSYGARMPMTPVAFPFAHHTMPGGGQVPAYVEWFKLPYFRLPGFGDVERYDAVVFNFPHGDTVLALPELQGFDYYEFLRNEAIEEAGGLDNYSKSPEKFDAIARERLIDGECRNCIEADQDRYVGTNTIGIITRPLDKRENYIKRCVGMPGDELSVINGQLHIDGKPAENPKDLEYSYYLQTNVGSLSQGHINKLRAELDLPLKSDVRIESQTEGIIKVSLNAEQYEKAKQLSFVSNVIPYLDTTRVVHDHLRVFPNDPQYNWSPDNFGPLYIPKEGASIELTLQNLPMYKRVIDIYEDNDLQVKDGKIFINGTEAKSYTFKMNYYFLMGDNRHNSLDSRFWGFVPENHVVGKAVFTWFSRQNSNDHIESRIRWERMFRTVK